MTNLRIGDSVWIDGRPFHVHGVTPMGVVPPRVFLRDRGSGEIVEVPASSVLDLSPSPAGGDGDPPPDATA